MRRLGTRARRTPPRSVAAVAGIALVAGLLLAPRRVAALVTFNTEAGWLIPGSEGSIPHQSQTPPVTSSSGDFSFGGALCPAAGTPDFFCANVFAQATLDAGGVALRASARVARHDGTTPGVSYLAHGDAWVTMCELAGAIATPASIVKFDIGLSGTAAKSPAPAGILVQAFGTAFFNGIPIQCAGDSICSVEVSNFVPGSCNTLRLRADAAFANQAGVTGWDAEATADFADTLRLLAIEPLDENRQPIPGQQYSLTDAQGTPVYAVPTSPASSSTTTLPSGSTTTTTTRPGGATTTTTLPGECDLLAAHAAARCRLDALAARVTASDAGALATRLRTRLVQAKAAIERAEQVLGRRKGRAAAAAIRKALRGLDGYAKILRSKKAERTVPAATRMELGAPLETLRTVVSALPTGA